MMEPNVSINILFILRPISLGKKKFARANIEKE